MASKYLDLYQGAGNYYVSNILGMESIAPAPSYGWGGFGQQRGTWRAGKTQKVVHDTLNNKYYGTQKQSDLVKGLEESIKRQQGYLQQGYETRHRNVWMGQQAYTYRYTAADRRTQNKRIKDQQNYLKHINNGGYKQEANTFFDSYNDHTQGWNNVFTKRYNNEQQRIRNERVKAQNVITQAKNKKIRARNVKIGKANVRNETIKKTNNKLEKDQLNQQATANSLSYNVGPSTNLEIGTGLASEKTKNRSKANAILADNGLNI